MRVNRLLQMVGVGTFACALFLGSAQAAEYLSVAKDGVNLFSGPDSKATVLYQLPAGYPLEVLGKQGHWVKVSDYEGDKGWIQDSLVNKSPHVIVKAKECNVRNGPSTSGKVVGNSVKEVIFVKADQKGDWVKVSHPDLTGWVHKDLIWP